MLERYTVLPNPHPWVNSADYRNVTDRLGIDPSSTKGKFVGQVTSSLGAVVDELQNRDHFRKDQADRIREGIVGWLGDSQHGVEHSFDVYQGARALRDTDNQYSGVPDNDLFVRAALHDMAEFLPMADKEGRLYFPDDSGQRRIAQIHPLVIAKVVERFAGALGIPRGEWGPLARDMKLQDLSFERPTLEKVQRVSNMLTPAGKLFNDADRLAGAGELDNPNLIQASIKRNRVGSLGRWYILRKDLNGRWEWKMRTGGRFDGLSALLSEFVAFPPDYAYTSEGKRIAMQRREQFPERFMDFYEDQRRRGRDHLIPAWQDNPDKIEIGIKDERSQNGIIGIDEEAAVAIRRMAFPEAVQTFMKMPVQERGSQNGRQWFGWSMRLGEEWFDPSILQFESGSELNAEFIKAKDEYQRLMAVKLNLF